MGTNYYWVEKKKPGIPCKECGHEPEYEQIKHHIGKSSAGWTFSFHALDEPKIRSWKDWQAFLLNPLKEEGWIEDECGMFVSYEDFRTIVLYKADSSRLYASHAKKHGREDGSFLDPEGHSFTPGEFS